MNNKKTPLERLPLPEYVVCWNADDENEEMATVHFAEYEYFEHWTGQTGIRQKQGVAVTPMMHYEQAEKIVEYMNAQMRVMYAADRYAAHAMGL